MAAFTRGPNLEGATWFLRNVWPCVVRSVPGATVVLAGHGSSEVLDDLSDARCQRNGLPAGPKDRVRRLRGRSSATARGAGLKFKVPQALAYGLPVVTTKVGVEGMPPACPAVVANSAAEMAQAVVALLQSPDKSRKLGAEGREWVAKVFDFSRSMEQVERRFEALTRQGGR